MLTSIQKQAVHTYHWLGELFICIAEHREVWDVATRQPITSWTYHAN